MTTSLASSPVIPMAAAGVAAALIFGTFSTGAGSGPTDFDDVINIPTDPNAVDTSVDPNALAGGTEVVKTCGGGACTITFPTPGSSTKALGTTVTASALYTDGITANVNGADLTANLTTPAKGAGYTLTVVEVQPTGAVQVELKKNK